MKSWNGKRPLWRVERFAHTSELPRNAKGMCRWMAVFWFDTRKLAQDFVKNKAHLPCRVVRDQHPEKHPDWPPDAVNAPAPATPEPVNLDRFRYDPQLDKCSGSCSFFVTGFHVENCKAVPDTPRDEKEKI